MKRYQIERTCFNRQHVPIYHSDSLKHIKHMWRWFNRHAKGLFRLVDTTLPEGAYRRYTSYASSSFD
jgi:hypothetical protein